MFWGTASESPHDPEALGIGASSDAMTVYYSEEEDVSYFRDINTTVGNLFVAIRDAIQSVWPFTDAFSNILTFQASLDVGYVEPSNIYVNRTMFRKLIAPDDYFHELASRMPPDRSKNDDFSSLSWGWGWAPGDNASWAQAFASTDQPVNNITLPIKLPSPNPPSVIDIMYLCPQYRLKSWGSLFMALFTGIVKLSTKLYASGD
ncbi:hypothetical protein FRC12_002959 [Ceratobasidium sp. 428]|nr:hypothetical protein FRC12_002959 [Ceratobasidium sp. 428]